MTKYKVGTNTKIAFLESIWQVGPILSSALVDIVDSRDGVEDTTCEAKVKDRLFEGRPFRGQEQESSRTKNTIFLNYGLQILHIF